MLGMPQEGECPIQKWGMRGEKLEVFFGGRVRMKKGVLELKQMEMIVPWMDGWVERQIGREM